MEAISQKSPLLSLPPEIRNRIYTYTLGGQVLHIHRQWSENPRGHTLSNLICRAGVPDDEYARQIKTYDDSAVTERLKERHIGCWKGTGSEKSSGMSLALLMSCQQIYEEAALIPYAENTFAFGPIRDWYYDDDKDRFLLVVETFLQRRTAVQEVSIKRILLSMGEPIPVELFMEHGHKKLLKALTNLQGLTILIDICADFSPLYSFGDAGEKHLPGLLKYGNISTLKDISLCVISHGEKPWKEYWDWWKAVEKRVIEKSAKSARQKVVNAKKEAERQAAADAGILRTRGNGRLRALEK